MKNLKFKTLGKNELVTIQGGKDVRGILLDIAIGIILDGVGTVIKETDPRKWNQPVCPTASGSKW